jgi:hypothetical protein
MNPFVQAEIGTIVQATVLEQQAEFVTIQVVVPGPPGVAAIIEVGTVTTLLPGESATVANVGTTSNAILDFGIPRGVPGVTPSLSDATPANLGTPSAGSSALASRADHVHQLPTAATIGADVSGAAANAIAAHEAAANPHGIYLTEAEADALYADIDGQTNWNTAFTERRQWDGGGTNLVAATGRSSLGLGTLATQNGTFAGSSSGTNTGDQVITSASDSTSHTLTLSALGGSLRVQEGSNINLATTGTPEAAVLTINSTTVGVTDGDKSDITVSGSGATWTIKNGAITLAKQANISTQSLLGRNSAGTGTPEVLGISTVLDWIATTQGSILYRGASGWVVLPPGVVGQVLQSGGTGADPLWAATAHNQAWSTITSTPTTLSGYGIIDAQPLDSDLTSIAALTTAAYGRSQLALVDAAADTAQLNVFTSSLKGLAPASGGGTANFLRADGTWAAPSSGGATNLGYTASTRLLTSDTGTDVTLPLVTSGDAGLAPASGGGTTTFLRADGTWAAPASGADSSNAAILFLANNYF